MSLARKTRVISEETRNKLKEANIGKIISPETRKKMLATRRKKFLLTGKW